MADDVPTIDNLVTNLERAEDLAKHAIWDNNPKDMIDAMSFYWSFLNDRYNWGEADKPGQGRAAVEGVLQGFHPSQDYFEMVPGTILESEDGEIQNMEFLLRFDYQKFANSVGISSKELITFKESFEKYLQTESKESVKLKPTDQARNLYTMWNWEGPEVSDHLYTADPYVIVKPAFHRIGFNE